MSLSAVLQDISLLPINLKFGPLKVKVDCKQVPGSVRKVLSLI